jgi:hypothetical protein
MAHKEIQHGVARVAGDAFNKSVDKRGDHGIANGHGIEWLQIVHKAERAVLLRNTTGISMKRLCSEKPPIDINNLEPLMPDRAGASTQWLDETYPQDYSQSSKTFDAVLALVEFLVSGTWSSIRVFSDRGVPRGVLFTQSLQLKLRISSRMFALE